MKFYAYYNVKKRALSLRAVGGPFNGRVVGHVETITMKEAEFRVSQAGRRRVLKTKRKNVHAGIVGEVEAVWGLVPCRDLDNDTIAALAIGKTHVPVLGKPVHYNPYRTKTFVRRGGSRPVTHAARVRIEGSKIEASGISG